MENKVLNLVKRSDSYKIIIPQEVEAKIRFACNNVWNTEWSGVLFYKPEGSFENNDLVIKCVDIYLMDIGNATYTEFDMSPDVIGYMAQNQELLNCQIGLIHSHHSLSTFFSGTDTATLREEGQDRNHFVSLIVNNAGSYTAAITRKVTYIESRKLSYKTFEDIEIKDAEETFEEQSEIEYFPLKIVFEKEHNNFQDMADRLTEIKKSKEAKVPAKSIIEGNYTSNSLSYYKGSSNWQNQSYLSKYNNTTKKDPTLFDDIKDMDFDMIDNKMPKTQTNEPLNEELMIGYVKQLISGSILVNKDSKINLEEWCEKHMDKLFDRRFGKDEDLHLFHDWATSIVEFILWNYPENESTTYNDSIMSSMALDLITRLSELPSNKYIKEYIEILTGYVE